MRRFHFLPISIVVSLAVITAAVFAAAALASKAPAGPPKPPKPKPPAITGVTLTPAPNPSQAGQPIILSGSVVGVLTAGVPVTLWRKRVRDAHFHAAFRTTTVGGGGYAVLVSGSDLNTNVQWYATTSGVTSSTALQRVRAAVKLRTSTTGAAPGDPVQLSGHVAPWHGGDSVQIQQLAANGRWEQITSGRLGAGSSFSVKYRFTTGTARVRALLPADPRNSSSRSNAVTIDVAGIHRIKHVVIIMQENRSFDSYFGTYPGADGIPAGVCVPDPRQRQLRRAVPRPGGRELRRTARGGVGDRGHRRRTDGRVRRPGGGGRHRLRRQRPVVQSLPAGGAGRGRPPGEVRRRDGLPRRQGDPELLGVRATTSCSRTTCSSRTPPGASRSRSTRSPNGRRAAPIR